MTTDPNARSWNRLAVASALLGAIGLWVWTLAPVALIVAYFALVAVNKSDGRQRGARLAAAGLGMGVAGCVLLVLGMFGILIHGLWPSQNRAIDANQLRQIGLALNQYHDRSGMHYPPAVSQKCELPADQRLSWMALQLPDLEQRQGGRKSYDDLAARLDLARGYDDPANEAVRIALRAYQSPSAPPGQATDFTSYVGSAGIGADAAQLARDDVRAGFFGDARLLGRDDLRAGASHTLAALETTRGGPWGRGGPGTSPGIPEEGNDLIGRERPFGGLHRDGLHLLFADARVDFRREDMPARLLREQARINRREPPE